MNNAIITLGLCALFFAAMTIWAVNQFNMPQRESYGLTVQFYDAEGNYDGEVVVLR